MADRTVNVDVNVRPGPDQLTPALEKQKGAARGLADELARPMPGARPAPSPLSQALAAAPVGPGVGRPGAGTASALSGALGSLASGSVGGGVSALSSALGSLGGAFAPAGAAVGALGAAVGGVTALVGALDQAFRRFRPSIAELTEELGRARGTTSRLRQTGVPTPADLRDALGGAAAGELQGLQGTGNVAGQRRVLSRELRRNEQERDLLRNVDTEAMQAEIQALLDQVMDIQRSQGGGLNVAQAAAYRVRLGQIYGSRGLSAHMPQELGNIPNNLTPAQARQYAEAGGTGLLARREANVQVLGVALSGLTSGLAPSLRPGAPTLADLPNLFQSRQTDFLELHGQVQQELVRDANEQRRFESQMRLWEQIQRDISTIAGVGLTPGAELANQLTEAVRSLFGAG